MTARNALPVAAIAALLALAGCGGQAAAPSTTDTPQAASSSPPAPLKLSARQINQQDRVSAAHKRRESQAMDRRPLLDRLPITVGDVTISIGGLAPDDKTTIIAIDPGAGTRQHALAVYRDALHAYDDRGTAYEPKVTK